jgi:tetratricopeptide (TPR) repeat protein
MTILKSLWCMAALCAGLAGFSQETTDRYLEVRGASELEQKPLSGATATLYEGNTKIQSQSTGADGTFSFKLDINKEYIISVEKNGLVGKRIHFNTALPEGEKGVWMSEFSIGLVRSCDGMDYSALKEPVDKVRFDPKKRGFVSDRDYVTRMRPRIEDLLARNESCLLSEYDAEVKKGDAALKAGKTDDAIAAYEAALQIYPQELYPAKQINSIRKDAASDQKNAEQEQQQAREAIEERYNQAMAKASVAYTRKDYSAARQFYEEALKVKPNETLPRNRMQEIETILTKKAAEEARNREVENTYRGTVQKADSLVRVKKYDAAREQYAKASLIKPGETYPKAKSQEIDRMEEADARSATAAQKAAEEKEYQELIRTAENQFKAKNYEEARATLLAAQSKRPSDPYPGQRIKVIDNTVVAEKQKAQTESVNRKYQEIIVGADQALKAKDLAVARDAYGKALEVKPDDAYAQSKISSIDNTIAAEAAAKQKSLEEAYKAAIGAANTSMTKNNLTQARESFQKALTIKPNDAYAGGKIAEVDKMLDQQRQTLEQEKKALDQYRDAMTAADKLFDNGDLPGARIAYNSVIAMKPGDSRASQRISEIDGRLAAAAAEKQRKEDEAYAVAMSSGAEKQAAKDYPAAREAFAQALTIRPGDAQAKSRIAQVESLIAAEAEKKAADQSRKRTFDDLITKADNFFGDKHYDEAEEAYEKASALFPAETRPRQRIAEISAIRDEQAKKEAALQASQHAYVLAVENGDKSMKAKDYEGARDEYSRATTLKPEERYPKDKLAEAEGLLAAVKKEQEQARARAEAYTTSMNNGNKLFAAKSYIPARNQYAEALKQMPDDKLAKEQIARIDKILATPVQQAAKAAETPQTVQGKSKAAIPMGELNFKTESEKQKYLAELMQKYPEGITLEKYSEPYKETFRYIIIRDNNAQEFRQIRFKTYNGQEFSMNGKPITQQYFLNQVKPRQGESFNEIDMQ